MANIFNIAVADVGSFFLKLDRSAAQIYLLEAIAAALGASGMTADKSARGSLKTADYTIPVDAQSIAIANLGPAAITVDTTSGGGTSFALPAETAIEFDAGAGSFNHTIPLTIPVGTSAIITEVR